MTALLFPGQGTQRLGMGQLLRQGFPVAARTMAMAAEESGLDLARLVRTGPLDVLTRTENAQVAVTAVNLSALAALQDAGIGYDVVAGHSVGLLGALAAADVISPAAAIRIATRRGALMGALPTGGAMLSVSGLPPADVAAIAADVCAGLGAPVGIGLVNGPRTVIVSGAAEAVRVVGERSALTSAVTVSPLAVSHAFHSALMAPAAADWADEVDRHELRRARVPVVSDLDGTLLTEPADLRRQLIAQLVSPVRWDLVCERLSADGETDAVECGDSKVLRSFANGYPALHVTTMSAAPVLSHLRQHRSLPRRTTVEPVRRELDRAHAGRPAT